MKFADRARDTTTTTGTGDITLSGNGPAGYQSLAAVPVGDDFEYCIAARSGNEWEIGVGKRTAATTLQRTTVLASSAGTSKVSFSAGTKDVFCVVSAGRLAKLLATDDPAATSVPDLSVFKLAAIQSGVARNIALDVLLASIGLDIGDLAETTSPNGGAYVEVMEPDGTSRKLTLTNLAAAVQSLNGGAAPADTTKPTLSSAQVADAARSNIVLTFSETLGAWTPAAAAFAVSGGKTVSSVSRSGATITLTCNAAYAYGDTITVTYTKPGSNALQDAAGNQVDSFGPSAVTNNIAQTADSVAPTASSAAVANAAPTVVVLTMSEPMSASYVPAASAFTVGGHTVSSVAISGSEISLTVTPAFVNGEAARTVAYTQPGTNNARDVAGNLLANFSGLAITNNVQAAGDVTAPTATAAAVANATPSVVNVTASEPLDTANVPAASAFAVSGHTVSSIAISGSAINITVTPAFVNGEAARTVSYTQPGSAAVRDVAGNLLASFTNLAITNNVAAVGPTDYNIFPYSSNAIKTTVAFSSFAGTGTRKYLNPGTAHATNGYWNVNTPTPTKVYGGWGTSPTTPPPIVTGQNSSPQMLNGMIPMTKASGDAWGFTAYLWVDQGSGTTTWYYWMQPEDASGNLGVAECLNPSGMTVTGA